MIDPEPWRLCVLSEVRTHVRKGAVVRADRLADVFVEDVVRAGIEEEALGELAVVGGKERDVVLEHLGAVDVAAESGLHPKHVRAAVLALEADEVALVAVENPGLGRLLERGHQVVFLLCGVRGRTGVADGNGFGELASREQAVEVAIELAQIGELIGRHG